jgi:4-hydroxy-3-methylbut-2-enyl diphosphate reductase
MGTEAYLIDTAADILPQWLEDKTAVGITAGASAPDVLVAQVMAKLCELGTSAPQELAGQEENITFSLPKELRLIDIG